MSLVELGKRTKASSNHVQELGARVADAFLHSRYVWCRVQGAS